MIVVSDTSPLHYLIVLGHADVLPNLYGEMLCPPEVIAECLDPHAPLSVRAWAAAPPSWLRVVAASQWDRDELHRLDAGEAAAIRVAHDQRADLLLMDERKGRLVAAQLGFVVAGVLAVLADASRAGLLDFDEVIRKLEQDTNFRASAKVIAAIRLHLQQNP